MKAHVIMLASMAMAIPLSAAAQYELKEEPNVVVIVGDAKDAEQVEKELTTNAPVVINEEGLPRFAIIGKERQFYLGIGAQFLGEGVFDFGDEMPSAVGFIPSSITRPAPGDGGSLRFSAVTSSFFINAVALPGTKNRVGLFFKGKLDNNDKYGFHVSHFYVNYRGFNLGLNHSLFQDGAAMPFTIDDQGPNGAVAKTIFTINYTHDFGKCISAAIGLEEPTAGFDAYTTTREVSQRIPSVPLFVQYAWDGGNSHVRLSGMLRPMQYRDLTANMNRTLCGGGVQLSGLIDFSPVTFYYGATYGAGISEFLQDDSGLNLDAIASDKAGRMKSMRNFGLDAGLSVQLTKRLTLNAVYSHLLNTRPDGSYVDGSAYRYGDYAAANLMYNFSRIIAAGIEYDYGHMKNFSGESLHTNRLQAQLAVSF